MNELSRQQRKARQLVFNISVIFVFVILYIGFFRIQVAGGEKYYEISLDNSVRQLVQYPVRGTIRDINGQILVDNSIKQGKTEAYRSLHQKLKTNKGNKGKSNESRDYGDSASSDLSLLGKQLLG